MKDIRSMAQIVGGGEKGTTCNEEEWGYKYLISSSLKASYTW
jgi:hypothetical protein